MKRALLLFLLICALPVTGKTILEVIPLRSQSADAIIPVLQPLLAPDGTVTGMRNQLIIKADEARLPEIRSIINSLDHPPRRLIIEVSHHGYKSNNRDGFGARGTIPLTESTRLNIRNHNGGDLQLNVRQSRTRNRFSGNQRIHALEGHPALIRSGQMVPVYEPSATVIGNTLIRQERIRYQDATSGFYVVPRIHGQEVTLEIVQHRVNQPPSARRFDVQEANTRVRGKIGSWIDLGGIGESVSDRGQQLTQRRSTSASADQSIYVRVTPLD